MICMYIRSWKISTQLMFVRFSLAFLVVSVIHAFQWKWKMPVWPIAWQIILSSLADASEWMVCKLLTWPWTVNLLSSYSTITFRPGFVILAWDYHSYMLIFAFFRDFWFSTLSVFDSCTGILIYIFDTHRIGKLVIINQIPNI